MTPIQCPRCTETNPDPAKYCRHCGLALLTGADGPLGAGRLSHPLPLPAPDLAPVHSGADLFYAWQTAGGGRPLLGTEPLEVRLFNAGYGLQNVVLVLRGTDAGGVPVCSAAREIAAWPRGATVTVELPSWELTAPLVDLEVELLQAEFSPAS